jgi:hypothetical protein
MTNALFNFLSDKYASGEASLDYFEAYLSFCESNDTLPRVPFTVHGCCEIEDKESARIERRQAFWSAKHKKKWPHACFLLNSGCVVAVMNVAPMLR